MKEPIRVLHIVGNMNRGGTETMLMNLYRNIDKNRIQFDFISFDDEEAHYDKEIRRMGGKIIKISKPSLLGFYKSVSEISNIINEYGPYRVVHAHTLFNSGFAIIASKKLGIKIRITHAHTTSDNEENLLRKIYIKYMRSIINRYSTHILACSNEAGRYLFGKDCSKKNNYSFFPNLIDYKNILEVNNEEVTKFKKERNLDDKLVMGHIGTLKQSKNQKFLIEITHFLVSQNYNVELLLVGQGNMKDELERLVKEYGLEENVLFTGVREDIDIMLHSMDIFIFPSIYEGLGLVLLEAQAAGLPCIVSEAIQEEADLGLGLIKQLNLSDGEVKWSEEILQSANEKKDISRNKIKKVFEEHGYSTKKCISKLMQLYHMQ
ncbi:MAG: glycosyltransferase family 1 protein [Romboutsia sp.]